MIKMSLYNKWKKFQDTTQKLGQNIASAPQKLSNKIKIAVDLQLKKLADWINTIVEQLNVIESRLLLVEEIIEAEIDSASAEPEVVP